MARQHSTRPERHPHHGEPVRLQAFLARSGVSSRRAAEELIAVGRVTVNRETVTAPGTRVVPGQDRVEVDGIEVAVAPITWLALHKPKGYVTTRDDPYGRATVYELIPERFHGLFHVGRLDRDSEGLLLLTNDGEMANRLLHPSFGITKEYEVDAHGRLSNDDIHQLQDGVELEDGMARAESVKLLSPLAGGMFRARMVLREGKKREVRRMMEAVGHKVQRLVRKRFGPIELAELPEGKWRVLSATELKSAFEAPRRKASDDAHGAEEDRPRRRTAPAKPHGKYSPAAGEADRPMKSKGKDSPAAGDADRPAKPKGKYSKAGEGDGARPRRASAARPERDADRPAKPRRPGTGPARGRGADQRPPRPIRPFRDDDAPERGPSRGRPARDDAGGERRPTRAARPSREDAGSERRPPRGTKPFRDDASERRPAQAARGGQARRDREAADEPRSRAPLPGDGTRGDRGRQAGRRPGPGINDRPFFRKEGEDEQRGPSRAPGRPVRRDRDDAPRGRGADDDRPGRLAHRNEEGGDEAGFRPRGAGPKRGAPARGGAGPKQGGPAGKGPVFGKRGERAPEGRRPGQRRNEETAFEDPRRKADAPPKRGASRGPARAKDHDDEPSRPADERKPGFSPWGRPGAGGKPGGGGPRKPGKGGGGKPGGAGSGRRPGQGGGKPRGR